MWRSTRLLLIRLGALATLILAMVLCFAVASWQGLLVLLAIASWFLLFGSGLYFLLRRKSGGEWRDLLLYSLWLGITVSLLAFVLLSIDPPGQSYSIWRNIGVAAIPGVMFSVAPLLLSPLYAKIGAGLFGRRQWGKPPRRSSSAKLEAGDKDT
mgnify:CR=1 FL=1